MLLNKGKEVIIRFPVIPGISDSEKNIDNFINYLSSIKSVKEVDILPYHDVEEKYKRLGKDYKMEESKAPPKERIEYIKERFEEIGINVKIGG